jgi:CheY-like chemotaxis protein
MALVDGGPETILLAEDDQALLELSASILPERGYHLLAARTPGEALRIAATYAGAIALLLTDVVMPR